MADVTSVSELFDPTAWRAVEVELTDTTYHRALAQGTVRVAINRPEVRNAFRPAPSTSFTWSSTMPASGPT